jgi:hypothetical protein
MSVAIPVHFLCQIPDGSKPRQGIACLPKVTDLHNTPHHRPYHRTEDLRAVTCQLCKASSQYKTAISKMPK